MAAYRKPVAQATSAMSSAEIFDPANPDAGFRVLASMMSAARARHTATLLNNAEAIAAVSTCTAE